MKEIVVASGITVHRGYLITQALFAAKPVTRRSLAYHMSGSAWRIPIPRPPCATRLGTELAIDARYPMVDVSAG